MFDKIGIWEWIYHMQTAYPSSYYILRAVLEDICCIKERNWKTY